MYNICFIDDAFISPINEKSFALEIPLCHNCTKQLLNAKWDDANVQQLASKLLENNNFNITCFTNPSLLLKYTHNFSFDIIIFDWDYKPSNNTEKNLKAILSETFSYVFIYSGVDKKEEIDTFLKDNTFGERLSFLSKNDTNSVQILQDKFKKLIADNFSFKFGSLLKKASNDAINHILINMSTFDLSRAIEILNIEKENSKELIEFITGKFHNHIEENPEVHNILNSYSKEIEFPSENNATLEKNDTPPENNNASEYKALWKYRLYHKPTDNFVRKGDIVKYKQGDATYFYVILNPNCELLRFWAKTLLGNLVLVELIDLEKDSRIKNNLKIINNNNSFDVTSLCNPLKIPGDALLFPYLKEEKNFILYPRCISNMPIQIPLAINNAIEYLTDPKTLNKTLPDEMKKTLKNDFDVSILNKKNLRNIPLTYKLLTSFEHINTLCEPFLTAVIEHVFSTLKGYGAPDYPTKMQETLSKYTKENLTVDSNNTSKGK